MLIKTLLMTCLLFIFYQDMRYRAVSWFAFPLLLVLLVYISAGSAPVESLLMDRVFNLSFLLLQLGILTVYFSVKQRKIVNITRGLLGWGDILFLLCLAFYLSPVNYVVFYVGSLIVALLISLLSLMKNEPAKNKVPLAGVQALLFAGLALADWNSTLFNLTSDNWYLNFITL
ncbi:hypothetical protein BDE36_2617 [Arcticibacter tournemirensis]|nr:hypothetical protein BDE36_2617 [Arcticibacter tournemirensis]